MVTIIFRGRHSGFQREGRVEEERGGGAKVLMLVPSASLVSPHTIYFIRINFSVNLHSYAYY